MRRPPTPIQSRAERLVTGLLGATLLASGVLAAGLARDEIAIRGVVCGVEHFHCGWCYGAASFVLAGLTALAVALRPQASEIRSAPHQGRPLARAAGYPAG